MNLERKISLPNLILVSGNGRNSGKTLLVRKIISFFAPQIPVTAVKISPHFHPIDPGSVVLKTDAFTICEERTISSKDSSLMWQAGAKKVYFIMTKQENLKEAFLALQSLLVPSLIICESGGLHQVVEPGIHFFVSELGASLKKELPQNPDAVVVTRTNGSFDLNLNHLVCDTGHNRFNVMLRKDVELNDSSTLVKPAKTG